MTKSGATFLHSLPPDLPRNVAVDVSTDFERRFLHPLQVRRVLYVYAESEAARHGGLSPGPHAEP